MSNEHGQLHPKPQPRAGGQGGQLCLSLVAAWLSRQKVRNNRFNPSHIYLYKIHSSCHLTVPFEYTHCLHHFAVFLILSWLNLVDNTADKYSELFSFSCSFAGVRKEGNGQQAGRVQNWSLHTQVFVMGWEPSHFWHGALPCLLQSLHWLLVAMQFGSMWVVHIKWSINE